MEAAESPHHGYSAVDASSETRQAGFRGGIDSPAASSAVVGAATGLCSPQPLLAGIHVVVQRCSKARLLVAEAEDTWTEVGRGLVLYVSFSKGTISEAGAASEVAARSLKQAAKSLLTAPLSSSGHWQSDHGDAESVTKLCSRGEAQSLLIIPQASLVCKLELGDRKLKYYQQCQRETAAVLFQAFAEILRSTAQELLCVAPAKRHQEAYEALAAKRAQTALVPPEQLFKQGDYEGKYSQYDEKGLPTHAQDGSELPKSAIKKLVKIYESQVKKYGKATAGDTVSQEVAEKKEAPAEKNAEDQDPVLPEGACLPAVVQGTFGGRQGFELVSSGPLTHSFVF